jgi:hypothetical protein
LSIQDKPANIKKLVKIFENNMCRDYLWLFNKNNPELFFHDSLLKYIDFNKYDLIIKYFTPQLTAQCDNGDGKSKEIKLNKNRKVYIGRNLIYQTQMKNPAVINSFQELFIKNIDEKEVFKRFYRNYELKIKSDVDDMMNEKERLDDLKNWEFIGKGLYEIY